MLEQAQKIWTIFSEKIDNLLNRNGGGAIYCFDGNFAHQYFWSVCHHD